MTQPDWSRLNAGQVLAALLVLRRLTGRPCRLHYCWRPHSLPSKVTTP